MGSWVGYPYIPCGYFGFLILLLFQKCSILTFNSKLLLQEGLTVEVWEPPNESDTLSEIEEHQRKKSTFRALVFKMLKIIFEKFIYLYV
jgi:hypothetical protein